MRPLLLAMTLVVITAMSLPHVPRIWLDYRTMPLLGGIDQPETRGTDTVGAIYAAKVILNDPSDMYTRAKLDQTPLEAATWTKEASAP